MAQPMADGYCTGTRVSRLKELQELAVFRWEIHGLPVFDQGGNDPAMLFAQPGGFECLPELVPFENGV